MFVTVSLEREENAVFVFYKSLLLTLFETEKGFILNRLTENWRRTYVSMTADFAQTVNFTGVTPVTSFNYTVTNFVSWTTILKSDI
jgi:hypothetical protein